MSTKRNVIHHSDAMRLINTGEPVDLKVWKVSTGDILELKGVQAAGGHWRGGTHLFKFPESQVLRRIRDICIFEINNMTIYL